LVGSVHGGKKKSEKKSKKCGKNYTNAVLVRQIYGAFAKKNMKKSWKDNYEEISVPNGFYVGLTAEARRRRVKPSERRN
jgi:hypothetical protein